MNETIDRSTLKETCHRAHDDLGFTHFVDLYIVDHIDRVDRFECVYRARNPRTLEQLCIKVGVPEQDARVKTVVDIWCAAAWFEREAYDLFGINFEGHKNLTRLLTPEGFEGHPLQKDFCSKSQITNSKLQINSPPLKHRRASPL